MVKVKQSTNDENGILTSSYAIDYVYRGKAFSLVDVFDLTSESTNSFVWDCSGADYVSALPPSFSCDGGSIKVNIYIDTDYTGVNSLNVVNRNVYSNLVAKCTLKDTGTGTDKGTKIFSYLIPAGKKEVGSLTNTLTFVPDNRIYLIEIENQATSEVQLGINFTWFED
jgi:hypothetical protein